MNFNENLTLLSEFDKIHKNQNVDNENLKNKSEIKQHYLEISEELESYNILTRYNAISKLLSTLIKQRDINFMLNDKIDENFSIKHIEQACETGIINDLTKNLAYFYTKFLEYNKYILYIIFRDSITVKKLTHIFFMKINVLLLFLLLFFQKNKSDMKILIKNQGDELEEVVLKLLKLSTTHKYIPNRLLLCLHYTFLRILISEDNDDEMYTCRRVEKKDKKLTRGNIDIYAT